MATDDLARRKLLGILAGSWLAQAVYCVVKLGVPDLLAHGPRSVEDLSLACGADPPTLARVLRALTMVGLFSQPEPGQFALTATTQLLRSDAPGSVRPNALLQGEEIFRSFTEMMHTMRTGEPAFAKVYGQPFYDYLGTHPQAADAFHQSMGDQPVPAALSTCDFSGVGVVIDVGGGNGRLLIDLLSRHAGLRAILVELPEAIRQARAEFARAGLTARVECVPGSFFDHVPGAGDVYLLSRVLHNWTDEQATRILDQVHTAMPAQARLIVLEDLLPESVAGAGRAGTGMIDLLMLITLDGRERTESEYRALLARAGFGSVTVRRSPDSAVSAALEATRL
jgi:hypothetical protein